MGLVGIEGQQAYQEGDEGVERGEEEEGHEEAHVAGADASAHPRAVVVVHLDAHAAGAAVETARRTQHLAGGTTGHLIMRVGIVDYLLALRVFLQELVFKLVFVVELGHIIGNTQLAHSLLALRLIFVQGIVAQIFVGFEFTVVWQDVVHGHAWYYSWFGRRDVEEAEKTYRKTYQVDDDQEYFQGCVELLVH